MPFIQSYGGSNVAFSSLGDIVAKVSPRGGGGYVVAYNVFDDMGEDFRNEIHVQMIDASGAQVGRNIEVAATGSQPNVLGLADGGFVVAWAGPGNVMARVYSANGIAEGPAFVVGPVSQYIVPALALEENGNFVVFLEGGEFRRYDDDGVPVNDGGPPPPVPVEPETVRSDFGDGTYVLLGIDGVVQRYAADGTPIGEAIVNARGPLTAIAVTEDGAFAATGEDVRPGTTSVDVYSMLFEYKEDGAMEGDGLAWGSAGDDVIAGSIGYTAIYGREGDDDLSVVRSGAVDATIEGGVGNDTLTLALAGGDKGVARGGAGDDILLRSGGGNTTLDGGDGDDRFEIGGDGTILVEAGGGDDEVRLGDLVTGVDIRLGGGSDTIVFGAGSVSAAAHIVSAFDIGTGNGADVLNLDALLAAELNGWDGTSNPFQTGYARLVQSGAVATLQVDVDGSTGAAGFVDLARFRTNAAGFTAYNFGGWAPGAAVLTGNVIEGTDNANTLLGTTGADIILGKGENDILRGGDGDDLLTGGTGRDRLTGGDGADTLDGGEGFDWALYEGNTVHMDVANGTGILAANGDIFISIEGYRLSGFNDIFFGSDAAETIDGGGGNDYMSGRGGNDYYYVDRFGDQVIEAAGEGIDTVESLVSFQLGGNIENLKLAGQNAKLGTGNALDNVIAVTSGNADNAINGGAGADEMSAGLGDDVYYVDNEGDVVIEKDGQGGDTVNASASFSLAGQYIEVLNLIGNGAINGTGNNLDNRIIGSTGANILDGRGGNDILDGGLGADTMIGGLGNDYFYVDQAGDKIVEKAGEGTDTVSASISYSLAGQYVEVLKLKGTENLDGTGNNQANILEGNSGNNLLDGKGGADEMRGGAGNDTYVVDHAGDKAFEAVADGDDIVLASVSYSLVGQYVESLTLTGSAASNATGNSGANSLNGNGAANVLNGGGGSDTLTGGGGADSFVFDSAIGNGHVDAIMDFAVEDSIRLDRSVFTGIGANGTLSASAFHAGTAAADAGDRIVYDGASGNIWYDADGSGAGAAVLFATVTAGTALTNADFIAF